MEVHVLAKELRDYYKDSIADKFAFKKIPSMIPAASSLWKKVDNVDTLCKFAVLYRHELDSTTAPIPT